MRGDGVTIPRPRTLPPVGNKSTLGETYLEIVYLPVPVEAGVNFGGNHPGEPKSSAWRGFEWVSETLEGLIEQRVCQPTEAPPNRKVLDFS